MSKFNTLRDRLLLRLLSQPTRNAIFQVTFNDLEGEISHCVCNPDPEHIAVPLCHLADLMEEAPHWVAQLDQRTTTATEKN